MYHHNFLLALGAICLATGSVSASKSTILSSLPSTTYSTFDLRVADGGVIEDKIADRGSDGIGEHAGGSEQGVANIQNELDDDLLHTAVGKVLMDWMVHGVVMHQTEVDTNSPNGLIRSIESRIHESLDLSASKTLSIELKIRNDNAPDHGGIGSSGGPGADWDTPQNTPEPIPHGAALLGAVAVGLILRKRRNTNT